MQRITKSMLEAKEKSVNQYLSKIKLRVAYRYNYTAIDIQKSDSGIMLDTLISGLTKREAFNILNAIETVLWNELKAVW